MNITNEEKLMYKVMGAIYDSALPISFKGSMVLKACLLDAGYVNEVRHTVDIDANWNSNLMPTMEQMVDSFQKAIEKCNSNLYVSAYREYGEGRSAGFEIKDKSTNEILFTMDVDVNRPKPPTKIYEITNVHFCGVSPIQMMADKVYVLSTDKIFRRIKDLIDLYYISYAFDFDKNGVISILECTNRELDSFDAFLNRIEELKHSYEKFRFEGGVNKPPFEEVYGSVKKFVKDVIVE